MHDARRYLSLNTQATILVALSAILYGFLGSLGTELIKQGFSVYAMLFWRFFIAFIWIMLWTVLFNKKEKLFAVIHRAVFAKALVLGAVFYAGNSLFYFFAAHYIGTGFAMVIFFTYPLFVVALSWLLDKHAISKHTVIALLAIVIGMFLIKGNHAATLNKTGIILALIASVGYGFYIYSSKKIVHAISSSKMTIVVCFSSALVFLIISCIKHGFTYPASFSEWFYAIALGIIATALPIQLLLAGLKHIHPSKASILSVLEPLVTFLIGIFVLHETASLLQALGALVILCSAICIQFDRKS